MRFQLFVAAAVLSASCAAYADTVDFSYAGSPSNISGLSGNQPGSGSFTFAGPSSNLNLSDLTSFDFSFTIHATDNQTSTFTYTLADLSSFSATLSGDTLLTLSLQTDSEVGTNPAFNGVGEVFQVDSLAAGDAQTFTTLGQTTSGQVTETSSTGSATPEPSSFALLGTGLLGVAGVVRRRFA